MKEEKAEGTAVDAKSEDSAPADTEQEKASE
jgi:hypothetical protein